MGAAMEKFFEDRLAAATPTVGIHTGAAQVEVDWGEDWGPAGPGTKPPVCSRIVLAELVATRAGWHEAEATVIAQKELQELREELQRRGMRERELEGFLTKSQELHLGCTFKMAPIQ
jgi:hypothetical protein